jgi:hypothetical protein
MARHEEQTTTWPGILPTLAAGFDLVTAHLWLVVIPILLDIFYWIGPRLGSRSLILEMVQLFQTTGELTEISEQLVEVAGQTNLFTMVSVPYLGVPGLMASFITPQQAPLSPTVREIDDPLTWLGLFAILVVIGLLIATLFQGLIAWTVRNRSTGVERVSTFVRRLPVHVLRVFGLVFVLLAIMLAIYIPVLLMATFVALLSPAVASLVMFAGLAVMVWLLFYLSFSMHGILLNKEPVLRALFDSMRLVQKHWLPALLLFMLILGVRNVLAWLWLWVDNGSWLTLVSIAGYAFINTSLLAGTYVFYRDRYDSIKNRRSRQTGQQGLVT